MKHPIGLLALALATTWLDAGDHAREPAFDAGYEWARGQALEDAEGCTQPSADFARGCEAYVKEQMEEDCDFWCTLFDLDDTDD